MMKKIIAYLFNIRVVLAFFLLAQAGVKIVHMDKPSVDYNNFYKPNAISFLNDGKEYKFPDGKLYISDGDIYKSGGQPPGYSLLIAFVLWLGGNDGSVYLANVLLMALAIFFTYKTYKIIAPEASYIYIALWVLVLHPGFLLIPKFYNSESIFCFIMALTAWLLVNAYTRKNIYWYACGLAMLFISIMTRSINLGMAVFIMIPFLLGAFKWPLKLGFVSLALVMQVMVLNVGTQSDSGSYLRRTIIDGLKRFPDNEVAMQLHTSLQDKAGKWQDVYIDKHIELLKTQPLGLIKFYLFKSFRVWYGTDSGNQEGFLLLFQIMHLLAFWIVLFLWLFKKLNQPIILLFALMVLYTNILATLNLSILRYLIPLAPLYVFITVYLCHRFYKQVTLKAA
jgi:hypothetical protein